MLKANELRIGNWVKNFDSYRQITLLGSAYPNHEFHEFHPIPITVEILESAGFKLDESVDNWTHPEYTIFDKNGFKVGVSDNSIVWYNYCNDDDFHSKTKEVKYVHQLQNLYFVIMDSELIIKL